ncbi:MAG: LacI family transcriptional regulator [Devosia sp.]|uniref:LacI family DNA-binding transcriptional regulator n=1 Tax=Devosia sp. TaxID=1871048 RepID=UPI002637BC2A|nr:LacI family DNA-binding transcriptional regulator [Devosia sp.]MDB5541329.1 LacI family transcriptional regulator [Devosia sp.]
MQNPRTKRGRTVRVEDVAREAGVSPITVSRALNAPDKVRPETRQRVAAAVIRTGYVVNSIASTLKSGRSSIVTVFVANLQNPHLASAVQGIVDALEGSRLRLMFVQTGWDGEVTPDIVESIVPFRPAGIVLTGVGSDRPTRKVLLDLDVPVVEIGERSHPVDMLVQISSFEAGRQMGQHFGQQGFSRIAFCGHTLGHGAERLRGFREGLSSFGLEPRLVLPIEGTQTFDDGVASLRRILIGLDGCDAIFYGSDVLAFGALMEAGNLGIAVPDALAIAGYGDLDFSKHLKPSLTTINIGNYDAGRLAGEMLRARLDQRALQHPIANLPARLETRLSTARSRTAQLPASEDASAVQ